MPYPFGTAYTACVVTSSAALQTYSSDIHLGTKIGLNNSMGDQESDLDAVKDERRPAAWAGKISPNVDIAAVDLSLNIPTCPSESMDPNFKVLPPNLLPTCPSEGNHVQFTCMCVCIVHQCQSEFPDNHFGYVLID